MNATPTILSQLNTYQTLISGLISVIVVILALLLKERFDRGASKRNFIRDNGYVVHERLKSNLKKFLHTEPYGALTSLPKKVTKEDMYNVNMSLESYELRAKKADVFSNLHEVTGYMSEFGYFEKQLLEDIQKVANLSIPRVQKVASKIEMLYDNAKDEETALKDMFQEELHQRIHGNEYVPNGFEKAYAGYIQESHKKIFWIKTYPLLLKLEKEVERVVKLKL